ncbi:MAG TPA: diguanylate cyclase [Vicinamibacterales bacterium]|nr:diguanylate cyclase [Vicinamibacterales bacterium]HPW19294.1 diguanylate cyclase [Vicinamibacterales bacterium]
MRVPSIGPSVLLAVVAFVAALAAEASLRPSAPMLVTPLAASALALGFAYRAYRREEAARRAHDEQIERSTALQFATIEALALAIDARDHSSPSQLLREQRHAAALAKALGMPPDAVEGVRTAALLHDIGKLAVPDHILSKSAPLTDDERSKMRTHAAVGAALIADVPFPYPVAEIVAAHHERWDGTGYPNGLRGADIPLGARVLAAVDHFAAVTSERSLGGALPVEEAINVLWQEAGNALDPGVVARYAELLPALGKEDLEARLAASAPAGSRRAGEAAARRPGPSELLEHIGEAHREMSGLLEVAATMGTGLGVAESMSVLASKLDRLVPFSTCALFLYDEPNGVARCRFATGAGEQVFPGLMVRDGQGLVGRAIATRACVVNGDPAAELDASKPGLAEAGLQSALVCPLVVAGSVRGALALYHTDPAYFTDNHRRLLTRVSGQIAAVVNNAAIFEQTREDSVTDPLTGLPNTRFLSSHAAREIARAARLRTSVAVLVVDLDNLKPINDSFGHQAGNRALCAVAAVLRSTIRPYDVCARYGGDEFIVLLSDCGVDQAEAKRTELQKAVESMSFSVGDLLKVRLSISAGAAVFPVDGESYEALLQVADSRMYGDKAARKRAKLPKTGRAPEAGTASPSPPADPAAAAPPTQLAH